jgi:UDP-4-amino-4,6-dideoxy-N-acetyl-beta-L-altrosamine N-acetyltransferase
VLKPEYARLRRLSDGDLELVLEWRNSPKIREQMYDPRPIEPERHRNWFALIRKDPKKEFFVFEYDHVPMGTVQFSGLDTAVTEWGFYVGKDGAPKGMGTLMGWLAIDRIFAEHQKVERIAGEVLPFNEGSARYHRKLGFSEVVRTLRVLEHRGEEVEILRFELSRSAWLGGEKERVQTSFGSC